MLKCLKWNDTIGMGVYVGETVKDCIRKNGRESILDILKYYDLDENILTEYHYRSLGTHQDNPVDKVSKDEMLEQTFVTSSTLDMDEEYLVPVEEVDDYWDTPVLYDPEDDDEFGDHWGYGNSYKPWIYEM